MLADLQVHAVAALNNTTNPALPTVEHVTLTGKFQCAWGWESEHSVAELHPAYTNSLTPGLIKLYLISLSFFPPSSLPLLMPKLRVFWRPFHRVSHTHSHSMHTAVEVLHRKGKKLSWYTFCTQSLLYELRLCIFTCLLQTVNHFYFCQTKLWEYLVCKWLCRKWAKTGFTLDKVQKLPHYLQHIGFYLFVK